MAVEAAVNGAAQITHVSSLVGDLARLDVSGLSQEDFLETYDAVARLGRLTDALRARFAGDLARRSAPDLPGGGLARQQGFGSAGTMVASVTGGSRTGALRAIDAGRALLPDMAAMLPVADQAGEPPSSSTPPPPRYPAVASATTAGDLSVDAAGLITAGLETLTDRVSSDQLHALEERLVGKAVNLAEHEVRRMVARAVARADLAGHEEREKRQHAERFLAWKEDQTGMVTLTGRLDAVTAAPLRTVIEQMVTQQFGARRDQDPTNQDQRSVGQMRADALFDLCRHALGCQETDRSGVRTTIVVRMTKRDLDTGRGLGRIDGTDQPVSVGQLRRLAGDAGIVPAVLGGESEVLDLGRRVRMFTRAQRLALVERDGGCAKCHAPPEHCEAHHIRWWDKAGRTDLNNGVMLCTRCHHDIHRQGWEIQIRAGRVDFIPPPNIDSSRRSRPGGLAAITIDAE
ncbi:HNH endonuclease signature motif containing protein [Demequina sp.]|uniref:HNH endonuclease n=1 Tax=Demequina sp. TaxID=2050685 RepID=UPI0025C015F3|nr:HNH endonuclease signature motif containing protein [Demequina sp.]